MALTPAQMAALRLAVSSASHAYTSGRGTSIVHESASNRWLDQSNRYLRETRDQVQTDRASNAIDSNQLGNYLAASVFTHLVDGWEYMSASVSAMIDGDYERAIHFAYYAELRAAVSIIASQGIGINNGQNFYFDSHGTFSHFHGRTHEVVWLILKEWALIPTNADYLMELINVQGKSIKQWLSEFEIYVGILPITMLASDVMELWSMDLRDIGNDHSVRNNASYSPHLLVDNPNVISKSDALGHVIQIWEDCEPTSVHHLSTLDMQFLQSILETALIMKKGLNKNNHRYDLVYKRHMENFIRQAGISDPKLQSVLLKVSRPNAFNILNRAKNGFYDSSDVGGVNSRALLLLRVATANGKYFNDNAGLEWEDIKFWWDDLGVRLWFWKTGEEPDTMSDLWEDIQEGVNNIMDTLTGNDTASSWQKIHQDNSLDILLLKRMDRILLWAVGE